MTPWEILRDGLAVLGGLSLLALILLGLAAYSAAGTLLKADRQSDERGDV